MGTRLSHVYSGLGHNVWTMTYNNPNLYAWLGAQKTAGNASQTEATLQGCLVLKKFRGLGAESSRHITAAAGG